MSNSSQLFPFLRLPAELRELVYLKALSPAENKQVTDDGYEAYKFDLGLLRVNRQIYYEARKVLSDNSAFVRIATPWAEAERHIRDNGYVPVVTTDEKAKKFSIHHLRVNIDAPGHIREDHEYHHFVILASDLKRFCEMWFYSDLGHLGLNSYLRLTLSLQDPYSPSFDPRPLSKALQKRLLEPFGLIKGLHEVVVKGDHYESIEKSMRDAMAVPYISPMACLEEAARLKGEGNDALHGKHYREAIELYERAFLAMHIVCQGRRRSVWADAFFQTRIHEGVFKGQDGHVARLVLRVQLVANIVHAYLNLENYEEARFWGERTINIIRENTPGFEDEPLRDFVAAKELGKIYFRTGKACKALKDYVEAKRLLRVALGYLPGDQSQIKSELDTCHAPRSESI